MNKLIILLCLVAMCLGQVTKPPTTKSPATTKKTSPKPQAAGQNAAPAQNGGSGQNGGPPRPPPPPAPPGCDMSKFPTDITAAQCCLTMPKCDHSDSEKTDPCRKQCASEPAGEKNYCCFSQCMFKQSGVVDADGKFNEKFAIDKHIASSGNPTLWELIVPNIVKECVKKGPELAKEFLASLNRVDTCGIAVNKAIEKCIAREFYLQCPKSEQSSSLEVCSVLSEFANTCKAWPFVGPRGRAPPPSGGPPPPQSGAPPQSGSAPNQQANNAGVVTTKKPTKKTTPKPAVAQGQGTTTTKKKPISTRTPTKPGGTKTTPKKTSTTKAPPRS